MCARVARRLESRLGPARTSESLDSKSSFDRPSILIAQPEPFLGLGPSHSPLDSI